MTSPAGDDTNMAIQQLAELRRSLMGTRRILGAMSAESLTRLNFGPTHFELSLTLSLLSESVKYQNRLEAEYRRR